MGRRADLFNSRLPHIEAWMQDSELPNELRHKVRCYYADVWVRHEGDLYNTILMLAMFPLFSLLSPPRLRVLKCAQRFHTSCRGLH